jgi:exodeoxyribonuclease III
MKILAWNLRHGGGSRRMPEITLSVLEHRADVVVLTEWRKHTGGQICGVLADHGLRYQRDTNPGKMSNGVLVASRHPVEVEGEGGEGEVFMGVGAAGTAGGLAAHGKARKKRLLEAHIPALGVTVIGVHVPPDGPGTGREAVFQATVAAARRRKSEACLVIGDLNVGRHYLDEEGATFTCTRLLGELSAAGFVDAWRALNPKEREYSWFSHEGKGFRIDHALVSMSLAGGVKACWYSHSERERDLSDHSLMALSVDVSPQNS